MSSPISEYWQDEAYRLAAEVERLNGLLKLQDETLSEAQTEIERLRAVAHQHYHDALWLRTENTELKQHIERIRVQTQ